MTLDHDHAAHRRDEGEPAGHDHSGDQGHGHSGHDHGDHEGHGRSGHDHGDHSGGDHSGHDHAAHDHGDHERHDHGDQHGDDHAGHEHVAYPDAVTAFRAEKDEFFRTADGSPVPRDQRATFEGLPYFPVDEELRFEGLTLEPYEGGEPVMFQIPTSDNRLREAERAGIFRFDRDGVTHRLTGYRFADGDSESVFVPFVDLTSGTETYGAGRYMDLYPEHDGTYALDFNLAYHPSCVYDPKYSCPLTPAENRLPIRIEAGERLAPGAGV